MKFIWLNIWVSEKLVKATKLLWATRVSALPNLPNFPPLGICFIESYHFLEINGNFLFLSSLFLGIPSLSNVILENMEDVYTLNVVFMRQHWKYCREHKLDVFLVNLS